MHELYTSLNNNLTKIWLNFFLFLFLLPFPILLFFFTSFSYTATIIVKNYLNTNLTKIWFKIWKKKICSIYVSTSLSYTTTIIVNNKNISDVENCESPKWHDKIEHLIKLSFNKLNIFSLIIKYIACLFK